MCTRTENEEYQEAERKIQNMEKELLLKIRKEADEKLEALRTSEDKSNVKEKEDAIMLKLRKEEQNVRDTVRKNILRRAIEYIKSFF